MINRTFSTVAAMVALGILTPIHVHAFGLGKLELSSALNEPFKAIIPVTALREDEEGNLQVRLATSAEFARAGIERSHYLTQLVFNVIERPGGAIIEVSSQQLIKEPFVDFLLTATTGEGRLLREYTVLLDPPKTIFTKPASRTSITSADIVKQQPTNNTTYQAPKTSYQAPATNYYSSNSYGVTKRDDTLWDIALATKPSSSVTVHQMMIALLDANPDAFIRNNINNLKTGYTLNVPSLDEIMRLTNRQAVARVSEQYQQWKEANAIVLAEETGTEAGVDAEGNEQNDGQSSGDSARLQLVVDSDDSLVDEGELSPLGSDSTTKLRDQLTLAQETIEGQEQENIDFKSRMDAMEKQLKIMQRIVMLKDADLARLQGALGEDEKIELASDDLSDEMQNALEDNATALDEEAAAVIEKLADNVESELASNIEPIQMDDLVDVDIPSKEAFMPAERMFDEAAVMAAAKSAMAEAEFSDSGVFVGSDSVLPMDMDAPEFNSNTHSDIAPPPEDSLQAERFFDEAAVAAAAAAAKSEEVFKDTGVEEVEVDTHMDEKVDGLDEQKLAEEVVDAHTISASEPIFSKITNFIAENKTAVLGGLAALFLGLIAWLFARRRNQDEYEWVETDSLEEVEVATANLVTESEDFEITMNDSDAQTSDLSQEILADDDDKSESVSDLLNQAEMSIAYGEYEDAHALVEKARVQEPDSQAVTLKLIALAYHQKQSEKFNQLVSEVDIDKDSIEWKEITEWGKELAPSNDLFTEEVATNLDLTDDNTDGLIIAEEETAETDNENFDKPIEFSLNDSLEDQVEETVEDEGLLSFDTDFDLGDALDKEDNSLEFDVPVSLDLNLDEDDITSLPREALLDIELETPELAEEIIKSSETSDELAEALEEKFDAAEEFSNNEEIPNIIDPSSDEAEEFDIGTDDLDFDIGDFDEVDEAETKLDLAAAYVDMGDPDGAKNILNEVLEEGNGEQKSRAQDLLNNLA